MALKTPSSLTLHSAGSMKLWVAPFTDIDDTDTYASGQTGIIAAWFTATDDPGTQTSGGVDVSYSGSTITFNAGEDDRVGNLYILTSV